MVSRNSTMLRAFANSIMNAWRDFTTPISDLPKASTLFYMQPSFVIQRQFTPPPSLRIYDYRVDTVDNPMTLVAAARSDLLGNDVTFRALEQAIKDYTQSSGPIKAHTTILDAGNWIGRFVIDKNQNTDVLVLRLVEGADMRMLKELA
jgi:hypothetical protein